MAIVDMDFAMGGGIEPNIYSFPVDINVHSSWSPLYSDYLDFNFNEDLTNKKIFATFITNDTSCMTSYSIKSNAPTYLHVNFIRVTSSQVVGTLFVWVYD